MAALLPDLLPPRVTRLGRLGPAALALALLACGGAPAAPADGRRASAAAAPAADLPQVLATIGGEPITLDDVRGLVGDDLDRMEFTYRQQRHRAVETALRQILQERVLLAEAERQGVSLEQLVMAEAGGSLEPSEVEVAAWYQDNPDRVGGRALAQIQPQIAQMLRDQRREAAARRLQTRLNTEREVAIHLEPFRLPLDNTGAPAKGSDEAPVTLVEFSDFECPFCGRFFPTLQRLEEAYGARLRIVYRQFPLTNIHPQAFKAAEASLCAHEQGRFWDLHDLMFREQNQLDVRSLKAKAGRLGLDQRRFDGCLDSGRYVEQVQADLAEGNRFGVSGTPALFVNGIPVPGGAVPFETVAAAIDAELARTSE